MTLKFSNRLVPHVPPVLCLIVFLVLSVPAARAQCQTTTAAIPPGDPFHMLVLGGAVMWGQGLRDEEKFSTRLKCWLEEKINREVSVHVEAHSGAVISAVANDPLEFVTSDGEVNRSRPTINLQLDHAIQFYQNIHASPSLILMNGCINDVGVKNLLSASTPLEWIRAQAAKSCGEDMQLLLRRVTSSFPQSQILVTSYYPIVSSQTDDNAFLRLLVKKLNNQRPEARRMTDKEMRQHLIAISDEWYKTSTASLIEAVAKTNAVASVPRVTFVEIQFGAEHVFA